jgi:acyl-coenzyme A synthetase/AMP-(fatty) acid ligase
VRIARTHSTRWPADRIRLLAGHLGDDGRNELATAGGYYHTGDIASRDADGYFTYIGRTDDLFRASDYKISAFELESVLIEHPAVVEALVVLAPDPARLTVPKAYISLAAGWAPDRATADAISPTPAETLRPINASGASNSWNCRRPSLARSGASTCGLAKTLANQTI